MGFAAFKTFVLGSSGKASLALYDILAFQTIFIRRLGERQYRLYWEGEAGEAPAEPKPSSAGASLAQWDPWHSDFILPLAFTSFGGFIPSVGA